MDNKEIARRADGEDLPAQVRMERAANRIAEIDEQMAEFTRERQREREVLHQARKELLESADKAAEIADNSPGAKLAEQARGRV